MKCQKCQKMAVLNSFDDGSCLNCGEEISTAYMPCDKVCESCSEKHKICQSCGETMDNQKNKWVTPKEIIGISELVTGYKYIDSLESEYNTAEDFYKALHYIQWLNETKLTPELVEKLFKGFEKTRTWDDKTEYSNGIIKIFFMPLKKGVRILLKRPNIIGGKKIETLADLARLTTAKPILLA